METASQDNTEVKRDDPVAEEAIAFDAAELGTTSDAEAPRWFEIAKHNGSHSGVQFLLVGRDARAWRALNRKFQNKRFEEMGRTRGKLKLTAEQSEVEGLELLVACVKGFRSRLYRRVDGELVAFEPERFDSTINIGGEKLSFNPENCKRVFKTVPEMREQVEDFLQDRANFLKGSPQG